MIIQDKEYALAAGAQEILGDLGMFIVIFEHYTCYFERYKRNFIRGASRLYTFLKTAIFTAKLSHRINGHIPNYATITMSIFSFALILSGGLQIILEFGSITFIIVSFLMAYAN